MPTNDEIINNMKRSKLTIAEQLPIMLKEARSMLKEARSDTTKQIFKEIDKIMNRHLNSSPIEDIDTADELRLEEDYLTLKRKYKVD